MDKIIILGDPHIGKNTSQGKVAIGSNLNSRIDDQIKLLDYVLDKAIDQCVNNIIITGDIWEEPRPAPALITLFISWLKKCQAYDVNVHIIVGNHDILRNGFVYNSPLDIISEVDLEGIHVYKDINTIIIGTTAFTLVPFRDRKSFSVSSNADAISLVRDSLVYELAGIPATYRKVLVGHLAIEGSIPVGDEIDDLTNELFCPLDMFTGYDYVWMGHVHKPQVMQKANPYIAHVGSMDISNFGETDHKKHIVIFNCDENNGWKKEELPTRPLQKIIVSVPKDTVDTTAYVIEQLTKAGVQDKSIVRVEVSLAAPELASVNKTTIEKFLIGKGAFNINGISEVKKANVIKKDANNTLDTKMDTVSAIKTYAQKYIEDVARSSFIEMTMDIYNTYKVEGKE
ncbi:MAG TPA: metallophosphoesterase [Candidatus Saccharimonadales bacterium]